MKKIYKILLALTLALACMIPLAGCDLFSLFNSTMPSNYYAELTTFDGEGNAADTIVIGQIEKESYISTNDETYFFNDKSAYQMVDNAWVKQEIPDEAEASLTAVTVGFLQNPIYKVALKAAGAVESADTVNGTACTKYTYTSTEDETTEKIELWMKDDVMLKCESNDIPLWEVTKYVLDTTWAAQGITPPAAE